jgi:hypothetical protein
MDSTQTILDDITQQRLENIVPGIYYIDVNGMKCNIGVAAENGHMNVLDWWSQHESEHSE